MQNNNKIINKFLKKRICYARYFFQNLLIMSSSLGYREKVTRLNMEEDGTVQVKSASNTDIWQGFVIIKSH